MGVDIADALGKPFAAFDHRYDFKVIRDDGLRQRVQTLQKLGTVGQAAEANLATNMGMTQHEPARQQVPKLRVGASQVVAPNRRIDQYHAAMGRLRGAIVAAGSVPPSSASRRDASHSTIILRPLRISSPLSSMPE